MSFTLSFVNLLKSQKIVLVFLFNGTRHQISVSSDCISRCHCENNCSIRKKYRAQRSIIDVFLKYSYFIFEHIFHISEVYSELCQTSKIELFAKVFYGFHPLFSQNALS